MTVRPATTDDLPVIAVLLSELRDQEVTTDSIADSFDHIMSGDNGSVLLVCDSTGALGVAVVTVVHKLPVREVHIDEVVVSQQARGRGLGSELMLGCEAWAREHNADFIEFTSRPSREAANHLYQKLGYQLRSTNVYRKARAEFSA